MLPPERWPRIGRSTYFSSAGSISPLRIANSVAPARVETAAFWSALPRLYEGVASAVREALDTPAVVLCHISHVYASGASLYFTVGCAAGTDPVARWRSAKRAAGEAIVACGGTISHHHGVGIDHRELYRSEVGDLGVAVMRRVKAELDPAGILNPGVMFR